MLPLIAAGRSKRHGWMAINSLAALMLEEIAMLNWVRRIFGMAAGSASSNAEFDPVYGLPRRAVEEWLARNPRLREEYEVEEWLARNPPLRKEYEAAAQQRKVA